jgi:DNA/RNA endonuclease YhcR with UshA esterase domain
MKRAFACVTAACFLTIFATAQEAPKTEAPSKTEPAKAEEPAKIGAAEAAKYVDKTMIVTGKVAQVTIRERLVYVNLDKAFPDSPFTLVVFARATNQFGDLSKLKDKNVEAKGKVEDYRGKPQIVLSSSNQLTVIEAKNETKQ